MGYTSLHQYQPVPQLYRLIKMRPSEPKILKIALIHEIVCICSIFLCRPPFLQIQSNNSLGNIFFFVLFLCCISHVQKNHFFTFDFFSPLLFYHLLISAPILMKKSKMLAPLKMSYGPLSCKTKKPTYITYALRTKFLIVLYYSVMSLASHTPNHD